MRRFQIVMFGSGGVGKTALVNSFLKHEFTPNYVATIEDRYNKFIQIDGHSVHLDILDTAGTEQFTAMRDLYIKNADGFLLVYSITDESSFQYILPLIDLIRLSKDGHSVPIVIVGNKCDLPSSERIIHRKQVNNYLSKYRRGDKLLQPRRSVWSKTSYAKVSISVLTSSQATTPMASTSMPSTPLPEMALNGMTSDTAKLSISMPTVSSTIIASKKKESRRDDDARKKKKRKLDAKRKVLKQQKASRPDNIDLCNGNGFNEVNYAVTNGDGNSLKAKLSDSLIQFIETSAKENEHVESAFHMIVREMIKIKQDEENEARKRDKCCIVC